MIKYERKGQKNMLDTKGAEGKNMLDTKSIQEKNEFNFFNFI